MTGTQIGPYHLLRLIKRGGGGSVHVGWDQRLQRRVALKFVALPAAPALRQSLINESRLQASVNHHLVVQLYDVVELADSLVLVMEYVAGNDLEEIRKRQSLDAPLVLQIGIDLCVALDASHAAGVVHRDLKPANVLLDLTGHIKLADFGIAERLVANPETAGHATAGTPAYTPPELVAGAPPNERADLFALGKLLASLLPEPPPGLASVITHLTQAQVQQRPASAAVVRQQLLRVYQAGSWPQSPLLELVVANCARAEDATELMPAAPVTAVPAALSRLLQPGQWQSQSRTRIPRLLLPCMSLAILLIAVLYWWPVLQPPVVVGVTLEVQQLSAEDKLRVPAVARIRQMLQQAVAEHPGLSLGRSYDQDSTAGEALLKLELEVQCNEFVCSTRLLGSSRGQQSSDTRAMLPGAADSSWQQRLDQGVQVLFASQASQQLPLSPQ